MFGFGSSASESEEAAGKATLPPPPTLDELKKRFKTQLREVRESLKDDLADPKNKQYDDDLWIMRFLFNPKYSVEQCADRYRKMIRHREADGVNDIMKKILADGDKASIKNAPQYETINRAFPESLWQSDDIYGQPVAVQLFGRSDPKLLISSCSKEEFYAYALYKAEYMRLTLDRMSRESGKLLQWVQAVDLSGLGMKHVNSTAMDIVKSASNQVDQMYKECLGKIFIVNAPRIFHMIWTMMKLWVTERTAQKVTLLSGSYKQELPVFIADKSRWPTFLGGELATGTIAFIDFDANGATQ